MVLFRSLKTLIKIPQRSRSFLTSLTAIATSHPTITLQYFPFSQPLFLCLQPHFPNGSQSATFHGNSLNPPLLFTSAATPSFSVVRWKLLILTCLELPLLFPLSLAWLCWTIGSRRESVDDGFLESFVNVPNLISMGRLISGPVLGWYVFFFHLIIYVLFGWWEIWVFDMRVC